MPRDDDLVGRTFVELADTLVEGYDLIEFLQHLAERAVELLGVTEAGVVLADARGNLHALASSSERMRLLELIELQRADGPCLDCWRSGESVRADDLEEEAARWPSFAPAAVEAGFRSVYALPLRLRDDRIGALNLFAEGRDGLDEVDEALGQAMADVATIGIIHERAMSDRTSFSDQLRAALQTRITLEQAKGMVIEQAGVDADEAFALIRRFGRATGTRLSEVARALTTRALAASDLTVTAGPRNPAE
ncbi:MAG TPA: GAF and ANTAR domain-containing protein [Iamia sp.]|nr:GAF and ANTAR domain-containing protein [Iamia sp.]